MRGQSITSLRELELLLLAVYTKYMNTADEVSHKVKRGNNPVDLSIAWIIANLKATVPPPQDLITIAFGFWWVEKLLPDYIKHIAQLISDSAARAFFLARWGGEEAVHSYAIESFLKSVGALTDEGILDRYSVIAATQWDPIKHKDTPINATTDESWFADPMYGNAYVTIQEWMTMEGYDRLALYADRCGQPAFAAICRRLATEEARHHGFFLNVSKLLLRYNPEAYTRAFCAAYETFKMPGEYVLDPNTQGPYNEWSSIAAREAVIPARPGLQRLLANSEANQRKDLIALRADSWTSHIEGMRSIFNKLGIEPPHTQRGNLLRV